MLFEIERAVRAGASSLGASLHLYWPQHGANEIPEANIGVHVGHALLSAGWCVYSEAHCADSAKVRVDLCAIHAQTQTLLACEFKRMYDAAKADEFAEDFGRVVNLARQPQRAENRHPALEQFPAAAYGLLAATTHNPEYARWFHTYEKKPVDPTGRQSLARLHGALAPEPASRWDAAMLNDYRDERGQPQMHWLVYVIFPIRP